MWIFFWSEWAPGLLLSGLGVKSIIVCQQDKTCTVDLTWFDTTMMRLRRRGMFQSCPAVAGRDLCHSPCRRHFYLQVVLFDLNTPNRHETTELSNIMKTTFKTNLSYIHSYKFVTIFIIYKVLLLFSATMLSCFAVCFSAVPFALEVFNDVVLAPVKNLKLTYTDITFWSRLIKKRFLGSGGIWVKLCPLCYKLTRCVVVFEQREGLTSPYLDQTIATQ